MSGIFISYSRADLSFVEYLVNALRADKREVWVDLKNIPPSAQWQREIDAAIDSAESLLFVISPDSIVSAACATELARAVTDKKRIIPVVCRDVVAQNAPEAVRQLNWIFFRRQDDPAQAMQQLRFALDTDLVYWRKAGDLLAKAKEWEAKGKNPGFTLRGAALNEAEAWLAEGATKQPSPTPLAVQFITASRRAAAQRQRTTIGLLTAGLTITLVLAVLASLFGYRAQQENIAIQQRDQQLQARDLAGRATTLLANGQLDQALLLSAFAAQRDPGTTERAALTASLAASPYLEAILNDGLSNPSPPDQTPGPALNSAYGFRVLVSPDGKSALFVLSSGFAVYDLTTLKPKFPFVTQATVGGLTDPLGTNMAWGNGGTEIIDELDIGNAFVTFDAQTGKQIGSFGTPNDDVGNSSSQALAVSPDGHYLAADQEDTSFTHHLITIWDLTTQQVFASFPVPIDVTSETDETSLTFSPDSRTLAIAECGNAVAFCKDGALALWSVATKSITLLHHIGSTEALPQSIAFSPDGKLLAVGGTPASNCPPLVCNNGELAVYRARDLALGRTDRDTEGFISTVAFSPDGNLVISNSGNDNMRLWAIRQLSGNVTNPIPFQEVAVFYKTAQYVGVSQVAALPDGDHFLSADDSGKLLLWRYFPHSNQGLQLGGSDFRGDSPAVYAPDGKHIITGTDDGRILYWDLTTHAIVKTLSGGWASGYTDEHNAFALSSDGTWLADGLNSAPYPNGDISGSAAAGGVLLWNLHTGALAGSALIPPDNTDDADNMVLSVAFSPDNKYLAMTDLSGRTTIWDVATRKLVHDFWQGYSATNQHNPAISASEDAAFSPVNDELVLQLSDNSIVIWDAAANKQVRRIGSDAYLITHLDLSADGQTLATFDKRSIVTLWDVQKGGPTHQFSVATPNLNLSNSLFGLTTLGGVQFAHVKGAFTPLIAISGPSLQLLNPTTAQPLGPPIIEGGDILTASISPDDTSLIVGIAEGPLVVHPLDLNVLEGQACQIVQRNLTRREWNDLIGTQNYAYRAICPQFPLA